MALTRQAILWHAGSMVAGGIAVFSAMASQEIDVYAIWNAMNKIVADITTLLALLAPIATLFGAAYRTWNAKQVPVTAIAIDHVDNDLKTMPRPGEFVAAAGKVVGAFVFFIILFPTLPAMAQTKPVANPFVSVLPKLIADAQAALNDANDHNDTIAANCYSAIVAVATAQQNAQSTNGGGALLVFQKVRNIARLNATPQGTNLIIGCAALVQDAKLNMVQFFTNFGGAILIKGLLVP